MSLSVEPGQGALTTRRYVFRMDRLTPAVVASTNIGARASFVRSLSVIVVAITLAGCATDRAPSEPAPPPAEITLGPVVPLLDVPPTTDSVRVVQGLDGNAHVLVASNGPRVVREIVVSPSGEVQHRRVVLSDVSASRIDAAFDRLGRLHVLVDQEHLVCDGGVWRKSARTPWEGLEVRPAEARFVANAPDLVWAFPIKGSQIGAPGRWEIYGFGGAGGAIIWPWFTRGSRAVVVAELPSGFGPWIVIDPEGQLDTKVKDATADSSGNVYVVYASAREDMLAASGLHFVKLNTEILVGDGVEWRRPGTRAALPALRAVKGSPIGANAVVRGESEHRPNYIPAPPYFYGGATGGDFRLSTNPLQRPRALVLGEARDNWLGRGFPVYYVEFDDFRWSSPIEVGVADHGGGALFGGSIWRAYDLATTDSGRTFVVWPTEAGIAGRWIDAKR